MSSHNIVPETAEKPDIAMVETMADKTAMTWEQVRVEAQRDEDYQHSLSIWKSLKIYKAVSGVLTFSDVLLIL
jgi:hypothetical protein